MSMCFTRTSYIGTITASRHIEYAALHLIHFKSGKTMLVKTFLGFLLGAIMVVLFLVQMWELFVQFHSGMKAIAISFEERD